MTSNRFFNDIQKLDNKRTSLKGREHHHLRVVLRKKRGDKILLFDRSGAQYEAEIEEITKDHTRLMILKPAAVQAASKQITMAQALLKSKKTDFLIQKATELGIAEFVPITCSRAIMKIEEKAGKRISRWKNIALEAAKQSGQTRIPSILPPVPIEHFVKQGDSQLKLFLNENGGKPLRDLVKEHLCSHHDNKPGSVTLLCGPEGGWTDQEEKVILEGHFVAISLGRSILRAETAAMAAMAVISLTWN